MKKRSLLALVLALTLIMSVCTCAFGGLVASAATTAPSYDPWSSEKIATYGTQLFTESLTVLDVPEYDTSKAVYSKTTVTRNDANELNTTPVILLAKTNSAGKSGAGYEFNNSYLAMWLAASGGYSIALISSQYVDGPLATGTTFNFYASGHDAVTGFAGWGGTWPGGATTVQNSQEIITKIENGKISVWIKTSDGVKEILRDYADRADGAYRGFTSIAAGYATSQKISNNYNYKCEIWTDVDFSQRTQIGNFDTQLFTESLTVLDVPEYGTTNAVYSKTTVTRNDNNALNTTPVILLAKTNSTGTSGSMHFENSYLAMWLAHSGGYAIGLISPDYVSGPITFGSGNNLTYFASGGTTGFAGHGGLWPNGGANVQNSQEIITKIENGKISVWIKTSDGVKEILRDYADRADGAYRGFTSIAAGYATSQKISNDYNYKCEVWVDGIVEVVDPHAQPVIDETAQREVLSFVSTGFKTNTTIELYDYSDRLVDDAAVYTSVVADMANHSKDWNGPFIALAKADYKADEDDTMQYYWGVRLTDISGWTFGLFSESPQGIFGGYYIDNDNPYSNGTNNIPDGGVKIVSKVADGKISVWIDGTLYIDEFAGKNDVSVVAPFLGLCSLTDYAQVYLSNASVWVDNADYGYLGDLNADMEINLLDFIGMNKIIAQDADYQAFNEKVVAFNNEGTVGNNELIMMKKYILGVIDKLEAASAFGEDTVPADGLL